MAHILFLSNYIMNCRCLSGVNYLEDDSVDNYYNYDSFYKEFQIKLTELHKIYDEWYIDKRPNGQHLKGIQQFKNELDGFRFKSTSFSKKKNAVYITFKPCYLLKELDLRIKESQYKLQEFREARYSASVRVCEYSVIIE